MSVDRERNLPFELKIKIYADGADKAAMLEMYENPLIKGFTTNPTLMRKSGVKDYCAFAREILQLIPDRPISFEVFADDFATMEKQAMEIASWGPNVVIKIPVTNTLGESSDALLKRLSRAGARLNATALMTVEQVKRVADCLADGGQCNVSVFAGRIADTGRDPVPVMASALDVLRAYPNIELIWASPRELLNIFQADEIGCHIVTATTDLIRKFKFVGKDLEEFSVDTVKMFFDDAQKAGYHIPITQTGRGKTQRRDVEEVREIAIAHRAGD